MTGRRTVRRVSAALACLALSGCWLQPDYDGGATRWNPHEREITAANVADLQVAWSIDVPGFGPEPLVSGGRVVFSRQDLLSVDVVAVDATTGAVVWQRPVSPPDATQAFSNHAPTFVGDEIWMDWAGSRPGVDCAFGTSRFDADGHLLGTDTSAYAASAPVQSGDHVVQAQAATCPAPFTGPHTVVVKDVSTHQVLWTGVGPPANFGEVSVADGWIITGNGGFPLAGCGAATCTRAWQPAQVGGFEPYVAGADGPYFYGVEPGIGGPFGQVRAMSKADGQVAWSAPYQATGAEIALDDDHLYVVPNGGGAGSGPGRLMAFDRDGCGSPTCSPLWSVPVPERAGAPAVAGDVLYVAGGDQVHTFPADGCTAVACPELAAIPVPGVEGIEGIAVAEGRLVVTSLVGTDPAQPEHRITAFELPG